MLSLPVIFYAGADFYRRAWVSVRHRNADMNTLIALGTGAAFSYSVVATLAPDLLNRMAGMPAMGAMPGGTDGPAVYYEVTTAILTLVLLGRLLEARARSRTSAAISRRALPFYGVAVEPDDCRGRYVVFEHFGAGKQPPAPADMKRA